MKSLNMLSQPRQRRQLHPPGPKIYWACSLCDARVTALVSCISMPNWFLIRCFILLRCDLAARVFSQNHRHGWSKVCALGPWFGDTLFTVVPNQYSTHALSGLGVLSEKIYCPNQIGTDQMDWGEMLVSWITSI